MSSSDLIVKATLGDETRRFRIAGAAVSFAELARHLNEMFAAHAPFKTAYVDADGDLVTFSSESEFRDAVAQRADHAAPFKVLIVTASDNNNNVVAAAELNKKQNSAGKVPNVWLELPIWVRHRVMAFNRLDGDVNDAAQFDKLSAQAQERVHARFVAKLDKKEKKLAAAAAAATTQQPQPQLHAPSIVPIMMSAGSSNTGSVDGEPAVVDLKDEELWAAVPLWLQQRVVNKFVPHLAPQASEFASFVALPEHAKFSVRNRAAHIINKRNKFARKYGPHPPTSAPPAETVAAAQQSAAIDEAADRALWDTLPPWVQLKVAARAAHSGEVPPNPRDFATFQMLPAHVQAKLRAKSGRGKFHGKCW